VHCWPLKVWLPAYVVSIQWQLPHRFECLLKVESWLTGLELLKEHLKESLDPLFLGLFEFLELLLGMLDGVLDAVDDLVGVDLQVQVVKILSVHEPFLVVGLVPLNLLELLEHLLKLIHLPADDQQLLADLLAERLEVGDLIGKEPNRPLEQLFDGVKNHTR
jgi:hypothetical protein